MKQWGEKVLLQIEEVSMDMTGNYKSLVGKICPNAAVTVDRFHVTCNGSRGIKPSKN